MSQAILKLQNAGTIPVVQNSTPKLINWNNNKYDAEDFYSAVQQRLTDFFDSTDLSNNDKNKITQLANDYVRAFQDNKIKYNGNGMYTIADPNSSLSTTSKQVSRNILGGIKGGDDALKQLALGRVDEAWHDLSPYQEPKQVVNSTPIKNTSEITDAKDIPSEQKPVISPFSTGGYTTKLGNIVYRNRASYRTDTAENNAADMGRDLDSWRAIDRKERLTEAKGILNSYLDSIQKDNTNYDFSGTPFKDKDEYIANLQNLNLALESGDSASIKNALYKAGESNALPFFEDAAPTNVAATPNAAAAPTNAATPAEAATNNNIDTKPRQIYKPVENPELKKPVDSADLALRLSAIAADAISLGSSFVPGWGTLASAATGLVSTGLNTAADVKNNDFSWGRLGTNLALDTAGLLPGIGSAGKVSKIVKAAKWILSRGSMIPAIQDFAFNYKEKYDAFKNAITNMESGKFSKQDLYTVAHTTQELAGLVVAGKGIRNSRKLNKAIRNGAITHEKIFTLKGEKNPIKLNEAEYNTLRSKKTLDEQNNYLTSIGKEKLSKSIPTSGVGKYFNRGAKKGYEYTIQDTKVPYRGKDINPVDLYRNKTFGVWGGENTPFNKVINQKFGKWWMREGKHTTRATASPGAGSSSTSGAGASSGTSTGAPLPIVKNGGLIPFKQSGGSFRNTIFNPKTRTARADYISSPAVTNYISSLDINDIPLFNNYENNHDTLITGINNSSNYWDKMPDRLSINNDIGKSQSEWWKRKGLNEGIWSNFTGHGGSTDNAIQNKEDSLGGNQEQWRTLGTGVSPEQATEFNKILNKKGIEYYSDPNHSGHYRLRMSTLKAPSLLNASIPNLPDKVTNTPQATSTAHTGNLEKNKSIFKLPTNLNLNLSQDALEALKFGITNWFNSRVKYNPKPDLQTPTEYNKKVTYNLAAQAYYNRLGDQYNRIANNAATADQTINTARMLEGQGKANDLYDKGWLANMEEYLKTSKEAQDIENANIEERTKVANTNTTKMAAIDNAKDAFNKAKNLSYLNNTNNYLAYLEQKAKADEAKRIEAGEQMYQLNNSYNDKLAERKLSDEYEQKQEEFLAPYKQEFEAKFPGKNWETSNERINANSLWLKSRDYRNLINKSYLNNINSAKSLLINRLRMEGVSPTNINTVRGKSGMKVSQSVKIDSKDTASIANQKEINNILKLMVTEGNKTIRGLSNYSARLVELCLRTK